MKHEAVYRGLLVVLFSAFLLQKMAIGIDLLKVIQGEEEKYYLGRSIDYAGDINQDGYSDFIIGVSGADSGRGRVDIYFGNVNIDSMRKISISCPEKMQSFGFIVKNIGNVNGNGHVDFGIGSIRKSEDPYTRNSVVNIYSVTSTDSLSIKKVLESGDPVTAQFGSLLGDADINGDGYDDLFILSPTYNESQGKVSVYYGGETIHSQPDLTFCGDSSRSDFGYSFDCIGDVNNDSYDDIVIGSGGSSTVNGVKAAGYFKVYFGSAVFDTIPDIEVYGSEYLQEMGLDFCHGDFNGDSISDFIVTERGKAWIYFGSSDIDSIPDLIIGTEKEPVGWLGNAGDINSDGYDDFINGLPGWYGNHGAVFVYLGSRQFDGIPDVKIYGTECSFFGHPLSTAGDINGDGLDEFLVGEPQYFLGIFNQGRVYVYSGDSTLLGVEDSDKFLANPVKFNLLGNYPNPFNTSTTINYQIEESGKYELRVTDVDGREVFRKEFIHNQPGKYSYAWKATDENKQGVSSGIYLCMLIHNNQHSDSLKIVLLK